MTGGGLFQFLADSGPNVHIAPAQVFQWGSFPITNSILYGWICAVGLIILFTVVARRMTVKPKGGFIQIVEIGVDFIVNTVMGAFDDKKIARKYVPFFVTLFFFILFNNWLGLLPIVGEGFQTHGGAPLLRPFTGDLSATFAMGALTMILVYGISIKESGGLFKYLSHFFVGSPKNPLFLVIGLLEMFTDLTRVISLSLRLFLNITIGEMVIAVFAYLGHVLAPVTAVPFTLIEFGIAALQAYIFVILSIMYLAIAVNHSSAHPEEEPAEAAQGLTDGGAAGTMELKAGKA
ncbi:MAG TPA: F0F1 ATP synthase subunit A [Candidatus Saccharimonadales bacterium]|nr:F0F1 ATP synthase subunit A [Candidatus Saccharimonadales bacterium]